MLWGKTPRSEDGYFKSGKIWRKYNYHQIFERLTGQRKTDLLCHSQKGKTKAKNENWQGDKFQLEHSSVQNDKRCSVKSKGLRSLGMFKHSDHRLGARSYPCWVSAKIHSNRNFTNLWIVSDRNWSRICLESRKGFGLLEFVLVEPNGRDVLGWGITNKTEKIYCSQDSSVGRI